MRILLSAIILCLSICVHAQDTTNTATVDFGAIKVDSNFDCAANLWNDSTDFGVGNICDSKNQLEIRFYEGIMRENGVELIILTYNDSTWNAYKYTCKRHYIIGAEKSFTTFKPYPDHSKWEYNFGFKNTFDILQRNDIFLLADGHTLKDDYPTHDAVSFRITFKVNNNFRSYWFGEPAVLQHPKYKAIVTEMKNLFD